MATVERLTEQYSALISGHLFANQVKMMAVIYMNIQQSALENITTEANGNQEKIITELFRIWNYKTSATVQVRVFPIIILSSYYHPRTKYEGR